jgi:hypothetical protein
MCIIKGKAVAACGDTFVHRLLYIGAKAGRWYRVGMQKIKHWCPRHSCTGIHLCGPAFFYTPDYRYAFGFSSLYGAIPASAIADDNFLYQAGGIMLPKFLNGSPDAATLVVGRYNYA